MTFDSGTARDVVRRLASEASGCTRSPPAPDGRGWGAPDWRDANGYPAAEELDESEWRWEFLRRRHGYRRDWLRRESEYAPASRDYYFETVYGVWLPADPRLAVRDLAKWLSPRARRGTEGVFEFSTSGLAPFRDALLSGLFATLDAIDRIVPTAPTADDIFVRFDIGLPIKPQMERIGYLLEKLREEAYGGEEAIRKRKHLWPTYLRLLDANDAGASLSAMATVLSKHGDHPPQRSWAALQAAEELRRDWRYGSRGKG